VEVFEDVEAGVEADQVDEFERAHGVVQAELRALSMSSAVATPSGAC